MGTLCSRAFPHDSATLQDPLISTPQTAIQAASAYTQTQQSQSSSLAVCAKACASRLYICLSGISHCNSARCSTNSLAGVFSSQPASKCPSSDESACYSLSYSALCQLCNSSRIFQSSSVSAPGAVLCSPKPVHCSCCICYICAWRVKPVQSILSRL